MEDPLDAHKLTVVWSWLYGMLLVIFFGGLSLSMMLGAPSWVAFIWCMLGLATLVRIAVVMERRWKLLGSSAGVHPNSPAAYRQSIVGRTEHLGELPVSRNHLDGGLDSRRIIGRQ